MSTDSLLTLIMCPSRFISGIAERAHSTSLEDVFIKIARDGEIVDEKATRKEASV